MIGQIFDHLEEIVNSSLKSSRVATKTYHGGNPFTSMDGAVEVNDRLAALAARAPELQPKDLTVLVRVPDGDYPGVAGHRSLDLVEERSVLGERAVSAEPGRCWESRLASIQLVIVLTADISQS